jgi:two-component system OmpR family sensor kinase
MRTAVEVALRRPREAAEYRETLEHVADDVRRLQSLVVGLLQLARSADASQVPSRPLPLGPLLQSAVAQCGGGATLEASTGAADAWVDGDADLLRGALCNVLENAARYAPPAPVEVRVRRGDAATVHVVISDRGPGVPEAERERVFQPLTRLEVAGAGHGAAEPAGFGLGLAVARATARAFGGDLVCRARADGQSGAEFVFTLRTAAPDPPP